ncbi:hypothetical protein H310_14278 [Aphanomyces invadans]|uniref:Uncharacterized protein n=1 Tax=Aphanomyces invadans TaxID=157072 RepID=A0A024TAH5_9STRA|nr:hypothetical protein H310_14278 [Aphanomyces invadans]ETV91038.1 hypothetical protein H310_14278 [Aphanomyces invadans]|eukprot:XP_008880318.1 hypothetical protein H310_14278 [Aphanomyces invadans]
MLVSTLPPMTLHPDLSVLDLSLFNSIQALQQTMECQTIDDLVHAVEKSYHDLSPKTLGKSFCTLQRAMQAVVKANGDNSYKIPRSKDKDDDMATLEQLDRRIEEESRLDELSELVNLIAV